MKRIFDVAQDFYVPEISGAVAQPKSERCNVNKFHRSQRGKRFFDKFQIAYDSFVEPPRARQRKSQPTATRWLQQRTAPR
eukprot:5946088-Pyramimonas_sp.AAC.1